MPRLVFVDAGDGECKLSPRASEGLGERMKAIGMRVKVAIAPPVHRLTADASVQRMESRDEPDSVKPLSRHPLGKELREGS